MVSSKRGSISAATLAAPPCDRGDDASTSRRSQTAIESNGNEFSERHPVGYNPRLGLLRDGVEMAKHQPIPLIILAGSDPEPVVLPEAGADLHPLKGAKGMDLRIGGRPIIDLLLERVKESGCFDPVFIAGPARVYGDHRNGARVIDTDSTFGKNIEASVMEVAPESPGGIVAVTTCDILPEGDELRRLMEDYFQHAPLDFWAPLILAPERPKDMGASAWKPKYQIQPTPNAEPTTLLPGHLVIADTNAVRLPLVFRTFDLAYRSRNRGVLYRTWLIATHILLGLVVQDFKHLFAFRLPDLTATVITNGVIMGFHLKDGVVTSEEMAERLRRIFVSFKHRRKYPDRKGRLPLMHALSMAKDIDTEEEAREIARELS